MIAVIVWNPAFLVVALVGGLAVAGYAFRGRSQNWQAFVVFLALSLLWGFALPIGRTRSRSFQFSVERRGVGGEKTWVLGELGWEAHGYGMPEGAFFVGSYSWSFLEAPSKPITGSTTVTASPPFSLQHAFMLAQGYTPLPDTPELREAARATWHAKNTEADGGPEDSPQGLFVEPELISLSAVFTLVHLALACGWWFALKRWRWKPLRTRWGNAVPLVGLATGPAIVGSFTAMLLWSQLRSLLPPTPLLLPAPVVVFGTLFLASLALVLVLCRAEIQRGLGESEARV